MAYPSTLEGSMIKPGDRVHVQGAEGQFAEFNGLEGEVARHYRDRIWTVDFPNSKGMRRAATIEEAYLQVIGNEVACSLVTCAKKNNVGARCCWHCGGPIPSS
jgi:hypothetical protein